MEAAMICEKCHGLMIERPPDPCKKNEGEENQTVAAKCIECGHIQPVVVSFWRKLAA